MQAAILSLRGGLIISLKKQTFPSSRYRNSGKNCTEAYRDFGRGSGHPANLNFGDCFAYALARTSGEPLLFKGNDFVHTGITSALPAEP